MNDYYDAPPKYDAKAPQDIQHDAFVLIDSFIRPVRYHAERAPSRVLPMPFALPQISSGFDTPFARGYSRALYQAGIPLNTFLDFVDGLNMAMISSPPLQVLDTAGKLLGFVPHWTFGLAGNLLQTSAQVGMHVVSKTLSDRFLRAANERIFAPLGLRVRICKMSALRTLVDHPDAGKPEASKLEKFGHAAGEVILHLPLPITKKIVRSLMDKPPAIDPRITDPLARRLMVMHGYILPVEYGPGLPPPVDPTEVFDKMNGYAVKKTQKRLDKQAEDANVRRQILAGIPVTREEGLTKRDKKRIKDAEKGKNRKLKTKVEDDARREHHANENLIWLVIINEEDDAKIAGKDDVDSSSDQITLDNSRLEEARARHYHGTNDDKGSHSRDHHVHGAIASGSRWRDDY